MKAQQYAQQLFDKAVAPIMDLPLTDEAIKRIGLELAQVMLDEIFSQNTNQSKHDFYCNVNKFINSEDIEF
jgi:hypothetical protein